MLKDTESAGKEVTLVIDGLPDLEVRELERIKAVSGDKKLHPEEIVKAARKASSPLHHRFEWDNNTAADRYRLAQARALIRCVMVTYPDQKPIRLFPQVRSDKKGYRQMTEVIQVAELRKSYLHQFQRDLESLIDRYTDISSTCGEVKEAIVALNRIAARFSKQKAA